MMVKHYAVLNPTRGFAFDGEGDDGDPPVIDTSNPAVKALIDAAVNEATAGLKTNRDEILNEKRTVTQKLDELKAKWGDLDPEAVKTLMARFENDEEAQLIADGKVDEVIEKRTKRALEQSASDVLAAQTRTGELETENGTLKGRIKKLVLDRAVQEAAGEAKLLPTAVPDAIQRAHQIFQVGEDENPVALEGDTIIRGKDGKTALTVGEWLTGMQKNAPHWWAPSEGGGAIGGAGSEKTVDDETAEKVEKMSSRDKLRFGIGKQ